MKRIAFVLASFIAVGVLAIGSNASPGLAGDLNKGALVAEVLRNPAIHLRAAARSDVERGLVDVRVLAVLLTLSEHHDLSSVGPLVSTHSYYVRGTTRPSNHVFGRAVDISAIDGMPVSLTNLGAHEAVELLLSRPEPFRPDEVGAPWRFHSRGSFSDEDHLDHVHIGWEDQP